MNKPRVYLETSVISYLAARPSGDLITAANQRLSHDWWMSQRQFFELFISPSVIEEISRGNAEVSERRLNYVTDTTELELTDVVEQLAYLLVAKGGLPKKALIDAFHVAFAAVWGIEYLLTWNCTHIANAITRPLIESLCKQAGFTAPRLCTPTELFIQTEE
jgi:predicted nucleic acid-binding protein